jgi:iron-sulfur cluster repair protein YtfE (RIC family)
LVDATAVTDPGDRRRIKALQGYWAGYEYEVLHHHTVEDKVVFPALRERVATAVALTDRTDADHAELDELMEACKAAVDQLAVPGAAREATAALRALAAHMDTHLDFEDQEVLPLLARTFTQEEYAGLEQRAMETVGIGKEAAFSVPFIGAALDDAERAAVLAAAPRPMRLLYRLTRGRHARLASRAGVA